MGFSCGNDSVIASLNLVDVGATSQLINPITRKQDNYLKRLNRVLTDK